MSTINIAPMPANIRAIPKKWLPMHSPVFPDGPPTDADIALARELFDLLDDESKEWYGGDRFLAP